MTRHVSGGSAVVHGRGPLYNTILTPALTRDDIYGCICRALLVIAVICELPGMHYSPRAGRRGTGLAKAGGTESPAPVSYFMRFRLSDKAPSAVVMKINLTT